MGKRVGMSEREKIQERDKEREERRSICFLFSQGQSQKIVGNKNEN